MLTFYFSPGSSSMAPHIALHEVGAPFDAKPVSFARKEHASLEFRAINPEGKVPALLVDGRLLTEVAGLLWYLARRYPEARLLPENDVEAESQVVSWMSFLASTVHPARSRGIEYANAIFGLADRRLGDGDWAIGQYSIADIHLFRLYWRFRKAVNPPPESFPSLERHHARMMARDAVKRTCEAEAKVGYELPS